MIRMAAIFPNASDYNKAIFNLNLVIIRGSAGR